MERRDLTDMLWFMAVAEEQSFTRAAIRLGTSQSTLSHAIRQLEERLGLRLLNRTTRRVNLTDAGERLFSTLSPRIAAIRAEVEALTSQRGRPSGTVRLTLSEDAHDSVVWPKLQAVLAAHPGITLELFIDNGFRDIVAERFDAGVRLGESVDRDMIALRIGPDWRLVAVAAPGYLVRHGRPVVPQDLTRHACINHRQRPDGASYAWEFGKDGHALTVRVEGPFTTNSTAAMVTAARQGVGIAYLPEHLVAPHVATGALAMLLDDWSPRFPGYHLYYPSRRQNSAAFEVVLRALRQGV